MAGGWGGKRTRSGRKPGIGRANRIKRRLCIYVIAEEGSEEVCKIGVTDYLVRRLAGLQTGNWRKLRIVAAYQMADADEATEIENRSLMFFGQHVLRGEWLGVKPSIAVEALESGLTSVGIEIVNFVEGTTSQNPRLKLIKFVKET